MPEIKTLMFSYKEIATALVKQQNLHEGYWGIYIEFGLGAANISQDQDQNQDNDNLLPAAIIPVKRIGITRFEKLNNLSVDAAEVNPKLKTNKI